MAGIGFELRRVIARGGLSRTLGAALTGILVVAGPWLMTILSVYLIRSGFAGSGFRHAAAFQVAVIYSYALSLALFSALHFHFTRIVADLVWEDRRGEAATWLLRFVPAAALLSAAVAGPVMALLPLEVGPRPGLYRIACVLLFMSVNVMWIVMLFASLLRRHVAILAVFALGMGVAVALVPALGAALGAGGAVLGYAAGHALVAAGLAALGLARHPPVAPPDGYSMAFRYARKYRALILSGAFFHLGQWADKFVFWATRGEAVAGTPLRLFEPYDVPVYVAGLSIVPGLLYFVVYSETEIASSIRHFLNSLGHETLGKIREAKTRLGIDLRRELRDQSLFQLAFSAGAALLVVWSGGAVVGGRERIPTALLALAGAWFQYTLMTLLNFIYYFELYGMALAGSGLFLLLNGLVFPVLQALLPGLPPGAGFLAAAALAAAYCYVALMGAVPDMDRAVFLRSLRKDAD